MAVAAVTLAPGVGDHGPGRREAGGPRRVALPGLTRQWSRGRWADNKRGPKCQMANRAITRTPISCTADKSIRLVPTISCGGSCGSLHGDERDRLAELLLGDYGEFNNPNIPELEQVLSGMYERLVSKQKGAVGR